MIKNSFLDIPVLIYRMTVVVTWETTMKEIETEMKKHNIVLSEKWIKDMDCIGSNNTNGVCAYLGDDNNDIIIWLRKKPTTFKTFETLYHEIYHAVDGVAESCGLEKEKEARAYLFEYLVRMCHVRFSNNKKK